MGRASWIAPWLLAAACGGEGDAGAEGDGGEGQRTAAQEREDPATVRPVLEILPDGTLITKRRTVHEPDESVATREVVAGLADPLAEVELTDFDRALLAEYAAIEALYARNAAEPEPLAVEALAAPHPDATLFGLRTREHLLWLVRSAEGKRYTVTTGTGAVLAEEIDDATLGHDFPELHDLVHHAVDVLDE